MLRDIISSAKPSRSTLRVASLVSILLVATLAAPISFTPPGAEDSVQTVGTAEAGLVKDTIVSVASSFFISSTSWPTNIDESDYEKLNESDNTEAKLDIHANARIVHTKNQETFTVVDNYLEDSRNIAWIKAKTAIIEELNSGGTESSAITRAKTAIRDYYSTKQVNLIRQWNSTMTSAHYMRNKAKSVFGDNYVQFNATGELTSWRSSDKHGEGPYYQGKSNSTVTLINGDTVGIKGLKYEVGFYTSGNLADEGTTWNTGHTDFTGNVVKASNEDGKYEAIVHAVEVPPPTSDHDRVDLVRLNEFKQRWDAIKSQKDQMISNVDPFVNSVYTSIVEGQINVSDLHDPYTLGSEFTSQYNQTGWYGYAIGNLGLLGVQVPDLNRTSLMNVSVNGHYYNGMVTGNFSQWNNSLQINQTYQLPADGTFNLITEGGEIMDITGATLEINSAQSKAGDPLEVVQYRDYNYQTTNVTQLEEQLAQINELQEEIEQLEQQILAGGGFSFPDLGSLGPKALGLILVGAAVLIGRKP